jgi:TonB family protein
MKFNNLIVILLLLITSSIKAQETSETHHSLTKGDTLNGEWIRYYENGKIEIKGSYLNGKKHGEWTYFYKNGQIKQQGKYVLNNQSGKWLSYFENGEIKEELDFFQYPEDYEDETNSSNLDEMRVTIDPKNVSQSKLDELYFYDDPPSYPGGREAFKSFLKENLKYSKEGRVPGKELKVWLSFIVDLNGDVSEVKVLKGCDVLLDEEAVRVIQLTKWNPGTLKDVKVITIHRVPIIFTF